MGFLDKSSGGLTLLQFRGIPVNLHYTFIILSIVISIYCVATFGASSAYTIIATLIILFASTLLHEMGHAIMAARLGFTTKNITLYPFGGIALVSLNRDDYDADILVSASGPAVNFMLSIISIPFIVMGSEYGKIVFLINGITCIFNLIPALPLDGGRILRAILRKSIDGDRVDRAMSMVSFLISALLVLSGIIFNVTGLIVVGLIMILALKNTDTN